jgi:aryl-alcohol dehydrogenase-like predicted oxidoreductase
VSHADRHPTRTLEHVMRQRQIQNTSVSLTELGCGGAVIGNLYRTTPVEDATDAVDAAWEAGIRYVDTAPHYGLGLSERRLGAALRDRPRGEYVISSKVGRLLVPNERPRGADSEGFPALPGADQVTRTHCGGGAIAFHRLPDRLPPTPPVAR